MPGIGLEMCVNGIPGGQHLIIKRLNQKMYIEVPKKFFIS
jgi:hypothetical protein